MTTVDVFNDEESFVLAMDDFNINLHLSNKVLFLQYISEPPFGDSYHKLSIDGTEYEGYVWGCNFLFPFQHNYLICSYMSVLYERKTIIINLLNRKNYILPRYYHSFQLKNGSVKFTTTDHSSKNKEEAKLLTFSEIVKLTS